MRVLSNHHRLFIVMVILVFVAVFVFGLPRNQLLTKHELDTLLSENGINPIVTNDIGDTYTSIVYKDVKNNEILELIAYKNRWGRINTKQCAFYEPDRIDKVEVEYWGRKPFSYSLDGYVAIEILSKDILEEARSAEVILDNGIVLRAKFQGSNILLIKAKRHFLWEKPKIKSVEIYNDQGIVINGFYS